MVSNVHLNIYLVIILLITDGIYSLSFNQPKFCPSVSWEINGTTFADITTIGYNPLGLFIDNNNTIYATDRSNNRTLIFPEGSSIPSRIISQNLKIPVGIFVTNNGDIYIDNGAVNSRVNKWSINATAAISVMYVTSSCFGLFIDRNNTLYCSIQFQHQVLKITLSDSPNNTVIAAGTGSYGSASYMLRYPTSIYVDTNFDLYVADTENSRIQLFKSGQTNGTTLAGTGSSATVILYHPTSVMADGNGYLFIVNRLDQSVIRSGPNGYYCVVGCSGINGSKPDQLNLPYSIAFDSYGNMFVMDSSNSRIQKFPLSTNSCISYNQPKLCSNATWNVNATTFANSIIIGTYPHGIFVDYHDAIYLAIYSTNQTLIWSNNSTSPVRNLTIPLSLYTTLFVSINGDIYFENSNQIGRIDKWELNETSSELVTIFNGNCFGLFIDINDALYCSVNQQHRVASISLNNNTNMSTTVAGNGIIGAGPYQLNGPWGIFVNINLDLYVVDANNNRIQLFRSGELNGTTVVGNGTPNNLSLNFPTDVVLDADGYLFIVDNSNHRIIRAGLTDYYCVAGCSGSSGSSPNQLHKPYSLRFDSRGNIYVADEFNSRIQKFTLATNSCDISATTMSMINFGTSDFSTTQHQDATTETIIETSSSIFHNVPFIPFSCTNQIYVGTYCNISNNPCNMIQPCQNNGICKNVNTTLLGYICSCTSDFNGTQCQFDYHPCKPDTCWHNGTCKNVSDSTFDCHCEEGWQDIHCQTKINYCENVICLNRGVCRPLLRDYECDCLGDSFSGRHCEITASSIRIRRTVAKSFGYVAIIALVCVAMFVAVMDILKYCFGIDVTRKDLQRIQQKKQPKKRRHPIILRFIYVNAPEPVSSNKTNSTAVGQETNFPKY